jgi:hypothetical protein
LGYAHAHSGLYTRAAAILTALEAAATTPLPNAGFDGEDAATTAAAAQSATGGAPGTKAEDANGGAATKASERARLPLPRVLRAVEAAVAGVERAASGAERAARLATLIALRDSLRDSLREAARACQQKNKKKARRDRKLAKSEAAARARHGQRDPAFFTGLRRQLS